MHLILHCGLPKTGSSSLQSAFYSNNNTEINKDIHYIRTCVDQEGAHTIIAAYFLAKYIDLYGIWSEDGLLHVSKDNNTYQQLRDLSIFNIFGIQLNKHNFYSENGIYQTSKKHMMQLEDEFKSLKGNERAVIISSEHLGALMNDPRIIDIIYSYFFQFFNLVSPLFYLRDPLRISASAYGQTIKFGYSPDFYEPHDESLPFLNYPIIDKLWSSKKFNINIIYRHYKESSDKSPLGTAFNLIIDFCSYFGFTPPPTTETRTNPSLNSMQLALMWHMNRLIYGQSNESVDASRRVDDDYINYVFSVAKNYGPYFPGESIARKFILAYEDSYKFMEDKLGISISREHIIKPHEKTGDVDFLQSHATEFSKHSIELAAAIYINKSNHIRKLSSRG
jgi:hypothetical protein